MMDDNSLTSISSTSMRELPAEPGSLHEYYLSLRSRPRTADTSLSIGHDDYSVTEGSSYRDPDPMGDEEDKLAAEGSLTTSDFVRAVTLSNGTVMSRDELAKTPDGLKLLYFADQRKRGKKRGFFDAVTDLSFNDLPFLGMAAEVGGSFRRAAEVSDIQKKAFDQGFAALSDEEAVKLDMYSTEYQVKANGTFGAMVGDIIRHAPGFMFEFLATGAMFSGARKGLTSALARESFGQRGVSAASTLAVNRGTKILARELAEEELVNMARKAGADATRDATAKAIASLTADAREAASKKVATSIRDFVAETMGSKARSNGMLKRVFDAVEDVGGYSDEFIDRVAKNLADKAVANAAAKRGASTAFREWSYGALETIKEAGSRSILDFGTWGAETMTMRTSGFSTAKAAVADALAATFIEAPIRGAMMFAPNQYVAKPLIGYASGAGTSAVSVNQLALQQSALRTNNKELMAAAEGIATGMDLLEYVSENAGRGFISGMRAIGLKTGLAKSASTTLTGEVGSILKPGKELEAGGFLRNLIRKSVGSTDEFAKKTGDTRAAAIRHYLEKNRISLPDDQIELMLRTETVPDMLRGTVGSDFRKFAKTAVKEAVEDEVDGRAYRKYISYAIADMMARNNWGPDQTMNALQRMGHDGILGEMYEERYNDFAKGLLGLDDKKTHTFKERLTRALHDALLPGWDQLMAEAIGFAVPGVVRTGTLQIQRALNGSSEVDRARAAGRNFKAAKIGMTVAEAEVGEWLRSVEDMRQSLQRDKESAEKDLQDQTSMLAKTGVTDAEMVSRMTAEQRERIAEMDRRIDAFNSYKRRTLSANKLDPGLTTATAAKEIAGKLLRFAVLPAQAEKGSWAERIRTIYSSEQLADAANAQAAILADAAFLGEAAYKAEQRWMADKNLAGWRKIASKTVGLAAAVICGEPALAQVNAVQWASVDEGGDPVLTAHLRGLYELHLMMAKRKAAEKGVENISEELDPETRKDYEAAAKHYVQTQLLLNGVRMFSKSEALDRAVKHVAETSGYAYDDKTGLFRDTTTMRPFETSGAGVTMAEFYEAHKEECDKLRDDISMAVLEMTLDPKTYQECNKSNIASFINLRAGDPSVDMTGHILAAEMTGFGEMTRAREIVPGLTISQILNENSVAIPRSSAEAIWRIMSKAPGNYDAVPSVLVESLAKAMHADLIRGTDAEIAARKKSVIDLVCQARQFSMNDNARTFTLDVNVGDSRLWDTTTLPITFTRKDASSNWTYTGVIRREDAGSGPVTLSYSDAELETKFLEDFKEFNPRAEETSVVLVPASFVTTSDPVLLAQKLGIAREQLVKGRRKLSDGSYDYSGVHPAWRLNTSGGNLLKTEGERPEGSTEPTVESVLREEVFQARYYETHRNLADYNFDGADMSTEEARAAAEKKRDEFRKMYDNVLADDEANGKVGYLARLMKSLAARGVNTPASSSIANLILDHARHNYMVPLAMFSNNARGDGNTYISVDYGNGIDPTSALATSVVNNGLRRNIRLFQDGGPFRAYVTDFIKEVDAALEAKFYDPSTSAELRLEIASARAALTSHPERPSLNVISQLASAFVLGQVERARAIGHMATYHDAALASVATTVQSAFGSYIPFCGVIDVVLGGTGFSDLQARRKAGADPKKARPSGGILWAMGILNTDPDVVAKISTGMKDILPFRMSWAQFEEKVNQWAFTHNEGHAQIDPSQKAAPESDHPFARARAVYMNTGFRDFTSVVQFLQHLAPTTAFSKSKTGARDASEAIARIQNYVSALESSVASSSKEIDGLKNELAEAQKKAGKADVADATCERLREKIDELTRQAAVNKMMIDQLKAENAKLHASVAGGKTDPSAPIKDPVSADPRPSAAEPAAAEPAAAEPAAARPSEIRRRRRQRNNDSDTPAGMDDLDRMVVIRDSEISPDGSEYIDTSWTYTQNDDGSWSVNIVPVESDVADLDALALKYGANIIARCSMALRGSDKSRPRDGMTLEDEFKNTLIMLTGGAVTDNVINQLWFRAQSMTRTDEQINDDPTAGAYDADGIEDGVNSTENEGYGEKLAAAFDNGTLRSVLQLARIVSPETGLEFQGFVDSLRDNLSVLREAVRLADKEQKKSDPSGDGKDPKYTESYRRTLEFVDGLFNPRAVVMDGIDSQVDREALFSARLRDLENGENGVDLDQMIIEFLTETSDVNREPRSRKIAFFLSYLRSLAPGARRNIMDLVGNVAQCKRYGLESEDGAMFLKPHPGRFQSVSEYAATGSFTRLLDYSKSDVEQALAYIKGNLKNYKFDGRITEKLRDIVDLLSPILGRESPMLQAAASFHLYDALRQRDDLLQTAGVQIAKTASGVDEDGNAVTPELVKSVINVLDAVNNAPQWWSGTTSRAAKRDILSKIVVTELHGGLLTVSGLAGNKSAEISTGWKFVLGAYTAGLPETVARAHTLPDRNPKIGSKVAISVQGNPPAVQQFMDRDISDKSGFAYHAYALWKRNPEIFGASYVNNREFDGKATEKDLKDWFLTNVLPDCKQRMVWPDATHTAIMAKNLDRDYSADELYDGCERYFKAGWADLVNKPDVKEDKIAQRWFVPIYNGDHSSGVTLQIPTSLLGLTMYSSTVEAANKGFSEAAKMVYSWLGLDQFGVDTKRSSVSCCEFPGRSMRGIRVNPDGTVTKGSCRVHLIHNYGMEGNNDTFLGTVFGTGYGFAAQAETAKDPNSVIHKLHVMSAYGKDLTMIKSLITAIPKHSSSIDAYKKAVSDGAARETKDRNGIPRGVRGNFVSGSGNRAIMEYLYGEQGNSDLDTHIALDEDSMKVGVLNSKTMGVPTADGKIKPLMKYIFERIKAAGKTKSSMSLDQLGEILADGSDGKFAWTTIEGTSRVTLADLFGADADIRIQVVNGMSGPTLDFSYVDNSLMSYRVANVSHDAKPKVGNMARNNAIDGLTMGVGLLRAGLVEKSPEIVNALDTLSLWNVLSSTVNTTSANIDSVRKDSERIRAMMDAGADRMSLAVIEQLARDVFKKVSDSRVPPLNKIDCALVSSGAKYDDKTGTVVDHSSSPFLRAVHRGSRIFSKDDVKLYNATRRLGYGQINCSSSDYGFRHGMFIDPTKVNEVYNKLCSPKTARPVGVSVGASVNRDVLDTIEAIFNAVNASDLANKAAMDASAEDPDNGELADAADAAMNTAIENREILLSMFMDHHGKPILEKFSALGDLDGRVQGLGFSDLFMRRADGTVGFDRTAVDSLPKSFGTDHSPALFLGGTAFGLPRTPSYNGSMWLQVLRASVPVTEIDCGGGVFVSGEDAIVSPDAQSLKILGCDHDGDKASCYMLSVDPDTGLSDTMDASEIAPDNVVGVKSHSGTIGPAGLTSPREWAKDGNAREAYVDRLHRSGIVDPPRARPVADPSSDGGTRIKFDGYRINKRAEEHISNSIVTGLFTMARSIPVDNGDVERDFYGERMARATTAHPLSDDDWDLLTKKASDAFNFLKGHGIGDPLTAAHVSTSAQSADRARGAAVSMAQMLHLAQMTGMFGPNSQLARMFKWTETGREGFLRWIDFIYGVDGISNATFDDIKEQICKRLGWTPGMMDTVICDMLFQYAEDGTTVPPPADSHGLYKILSDYVESISSGGSRFYMMIAADATESNAVLRIGGKELTAQGIHREIRANLSGGPDNRLTRDSVRNSFGLTLEHNPTTKKREWVPSKADKNTAKGAFVLELYRQAKDRADIDAGEALANLVRMCARRGGINPAAGYVNWAIKQIAADKTDVARLREVVRGYLNWSNGVSTIQTVRSFTRAFNCFVADPGSGYMMGQRERMANDFEDGMDKAAADSAPWLNAMFLGNMCTYNIPGLTTMQGRMSLAAELRDEGICRWARLVATNPTLPPSLSELVAKLFSETGVNSSRMLQLEGNLQTITHLTAALTTIPGLTDTAVAHGDKDLFSGNNGLDAWSTMEKISEAMTSIEGNKDPADGRSNSTLAFLEGVVSMFNTLQALVSTSSGPYAHPAFQYLAISTDGKIARGKYQNSKGFRRIMASYHDKTVNSRNLVHSAFRDVMEGGLDSARRTSGNQYLVRSEGRTLATSYMLTADNLRAFLAELGRKEDLSGGRSKDNEKTIVRDISRTIRILEHLGEGTCIAPSTFVNQILPLYATMTARTTPPDPKSSSIVSLLPGVYERLSKRQAQMESGALERGHDVFCTGTRLMDVVCATNYALVKPKDSKYLEGALPEKFSAAWRTAIISRLNAYMVENDVPVHDIQSNEGLVNLFNKLVGGDAPARVNPEGSHIVDLLGGSQSLRSLHAYVVDTLGAPPTREDRTRTPEPSPSIDPDASPLDHEVTDPGEKDPAIEALADLMGSIVGAWADVVYDGGDVFYIKSKDGLRGSAARMFSSSGVNAVITVRVGNKNDPVKLDVNDPNVAASFCNAVKGLDITPEQFMLLTHEEREALVRTYVSGAASAGGGNFALAAPSWSLDAKGCATLAGEIRLSGKSKQYMRGMFHEYFHAMIGMFRTVGMFGRHDIEVFRKVFGEPTSGTSQLFNEEKAADAFAAYLESKIGLSSRESKRKAALEAEVKGEHKSILHRIFDKIMEVAGALSRLFKYGFDYDHGNLSNDGEHQNVLFDCIIDGYAAQSRSRIQERFGSGKIPSGAEAVLNDRLSAESFASRFRLAEKLRDGQIAADRFAAGGAIAAATYTESDPEAVAAERVGRAVDRTYADPTEGLEDVKAAVPWANALRDELARADQGQHPRRKALTDIISNLTAIRRTAEDSSRVDFTPNEDVDWIADGVQHAVVVPTESREGGIIPVTRHNNDNWIRAVYSLDRDYDLGVAYDNLVANVGTGVIDAVKNRLRRAGVSDAALEDPKFMLYHMARFDNIGQNHEAPGTTGGKAPGELYPLTSKDRRHFGYDPAEAGTGNCESLFFDKDGNQTHDAVIMFDTETYGTVETNGHIVQISATKCVPRVDASGKVAMVKDSEFSTYVKLPDGLSMSDRRFTMHGDHGSTRLVAASEFNNITDDDLKTGMTLEDAMKKFSEFVGDGSRVVLAAHNCQFDSGMMALSAKRCRDAVDCKFLFTADWLDTLTVFRDRASGVTTENVYDPVTDTTHFKFAGHKLSRAIDHYGLADVARNTHNAEADTNALYEVVKKMDEERGDLGRYLNVFGTPPKWGPPSAHVPGIRFVAQAVGNLALKEGTKDGVSPVADCAYMKSGFRSGLLPGDSVEGNYVPESVPEAAPEARPPEEKKSDAESILRHGAEDRRRERDRRLDAELAAGRLAPEMAGAAKAASAALSALESATVLDPVSERGRASVYDSNYSMLQAAFQAAYDDLNEDELAVLEGDKVVNNFAVKLATMMRTSDSATKRRLAWAKARSDAVKKVAESSLKMLERMSGARFTGTPTLNVLMALYDNKFFRQATERSRRSKDRTVSTAMKGGSTSYDIHSKMYSTSADFAGALLAASGVPFGDIVRKTRDNIAAIMPTLGENNANVRTAAHIVGALDRLLGSMDVSAIKADNSAWNDALSQFSVCLFDGVKRGDYDTRTGEYGPYVPSSSETEEAKVNQSLYGLYRDPKTPMAKLDVGYQLRQRLLRMAADAVYTTAAQVKFCREIGWQPGSVHHDAWMGRVVPPLEFSALTNAFGIGENQLTGDSDLIEQWNQPQFVAANIDEWLASTVRESFGNGRIRDIFMEESRALRGHMSVLTRKVNFKDMYMGLNARPGGKLLKLLKYKTSHVLKDGEFLATETGETVSDEDLRSVTVEGFDYKSGLHGDTTDISFTEDEYRTVDLVMKLARVCMQGGRSLITGVDKLSFNPGMFMVAREDDPSLQRYLTEDDLSLKKMIDREASTHVLPESRTAARDEKYRQLNPLEFALWRISQQWHGAVTGYNQDGSVYVGETFVRDGAEKTSESFGLYDKFTKAVVEVGTGLVKRWTGRDPDGKNHHNGLMISNARFNHLMLRELESRGLVKTTSESDEKDSYGEPLLTSGVLCIDVAGFTKTFKNTSAFQKLVDAGRDAGKMMPQAIADDFAENIRNVMKEVSKRPWLTRGDCRHLNNFDTMLPAFQGTGSFMFAANRLERDRARDQEIRLARHEMTMLNMIENPGLAAKSFRDVTDAQLRMIHDYFNTEETGDALRAAMASGVYAKGKPASLRCRLEVNPGADGELETSMADIATQLYHRQLERRLELLEGVRSGDDVDNEGSLGRMINAFENRARNGANLVATGLTDEQLYRMHGVLPANTTIGHGVHLMMQTLQNSLYFRSTFMNMMFATDADGDPLYYAKPHIHAAESGGIPAEVWGTIAHAWADRHGLQYDITATGVENARRLYDEIARARAESGKGAGKRINGKRYSELSSDEMDTTSIQNMMAQTEGSVDDSAINKWGTSRGIMSLDGSEALGYARHLFQTPRLMGGHLKWMNHVMAWSKTISVSCSLFFPLATKYESTTAAVGFLATIGSNHAAEFVRRHHEGLNKIQKAFTLGAEDGWLSKDFIGYQDIVRMMDTNDPFLSDIVMWAEALGITMTDRLVNPSEDNKAAVMADARKLVALTRKSVGDKAADNLEGALEVLLTRQSEKAFTYALNATKLAVASQVALKLKREAMARNRAFDPIRDMRDYAEYIDSEIGGVNPLRYAWAHPHSRSVLANLFFSWEWTRTAWEAGGGGIIEDMLFGGHSVTKAQRRYTIGRWLRMYLSIMVGVPMFFQALIKGIGQAFGVDDDSDDWFTWNNETKIGTSAFNITPLLKLVAHADKAITGGWLRDAKSHHGALLGWLPMYTGTDPNNASRNRKYYMHFGKQGWEFFRWFTDPVGQFFSKLSMPTQRLIESTLGVNPSALGRNLPFTDTTFAERMLNVASPDSAYVNFAKAFMPFTAASMFTFGDAGVLSAAGPVQMGESQSSLIERARKRMKQWADNDRAGYQFGGPAKKRNLRLAKFNMADIQRDARTNGFRDFDQAVVRPALQKLYSSTYREVVKLLPESATGSFDVKAFSAAVRRMHRLGLTHTGLLNSIKRRFELQNRPWHTLNSAYRRRIIGILDSVRKDPFGTAADPVRRKQMDY